MENVVVKCRGVKKTYGHGENEVHALKKTDLDVEAGKLTLLVGPSGSGKTTLISIIATILTPDGGELFLLGQDVGLMTSNEKAHFRNQHMGIVFQSLFLIPSLTVLENVSLPLIVAGFTQEEADRKSRELLEMVHLDHRANFSPALLSKGQQQRVAISRAMVNDSQIIICDEPTSALDHVVGFEIMDFLHGLAKKSGKAVLVVTHDHRIFSYADRVVEMSDGEIVATNTEQGK